MDKSKDKSDESQTPRLLAGDVDSITSFNVPDLDVDGRDYSTFVVALRHGTSVTVTKKDKPEPVTVSIMSQRSELWQRAVFFNYFKRVSKVGDTNKYLAGTLERFI